jgi:hypothetical protein
MNVIDKQFIISIYSYLAFIANTLANMLCNRDFSIIFSNDKHLIELINIYVLHYKKLDFFLFLNLMNFTKALGIKVSLISNV